MTVTLDDGVVDAVIDNPPVNVITRDLYRDLARLPAMAEAEPDARVIVVRSADPEFFIAHFDVELILAAPIDGPAERTEELHGFHQMCEAYRTSPLPTICEIGGRVGGGGGELAVSCDMRFGVPATTLCQMEVPLGILPGGSGTQRLPRMLGRGRAMEIVLAGDDIDGATLNEWGWLNRLLAGPDELRAHVAALAARIASFPPEAVSRAKQSVLAASPDVLPGLTEEAFLFQETVRTDAARSRMTNFLARGGQTRDGELRVGALGAELG
ncbi:MAG: enoyl-CoA hydratase/isomerase family protein [Actinomycetota bacterium]